METWPSLLPKPKIETTGNYEASVTRTQMESAYVRQRQRFEDRHLLYNLTFVFTPIQFLIFKGFHETKISMGADTFSMSLNLGDGLQSYDIQIVNGVYNDSKAEPNYRVSFQIDIFEDNTLTEEAYDLFVTELMGNESALTNSVQGYYDLVHVTIPSDFNNN